MTARKKTEKEKGSSQAWAAHHRVLQETGGKKMQAARLLAIDLKTLNNNIRDYQINLPLPR